jgi:hypothetical protein
MNKAVLARKQHQLELFRTSMAEEIDSVRDEASHQLQEAVAALEQRQEESQTSIARLSEMIDQKDERIRQLEHSTSSQVADLASKDFLIKEIENLNERLTLQARNLRADLEQREKKISELTKRLQTREPRPTVASAMKESSPPVKFQVESSSASPTRKSTQSPSQTPSFGNKSEKEAVPPETSTSLKILESTLSSSRPPAPVASTKQDDTAARRSSGFVWPEFAGLTPGLPQPLITAPVLSMDSFFAPPSRRAEEAVYAPPAPAMQQSVFISALPRRVASSYILPQTSPLFGLTPPGHM